jgi:hypothetical protein
MGRVVGPNDPTWTDDDRRFAMAYDAAMAEVCERCGTRESEWERFGEAAYMSQQHYCRGCERIAQEERNIPEKQREYRHAYVVPTPLARDDDFVEIKPRRPPPE